MNYPRNVACVSGLLVSAGIIACSSGGQDDASSSPASTPATTTTPTTPATKSEYPKFDPVNYPVPQVANAVKPGDPRWEGQFYLLWDTWGGELGGWPVDFLLEVLKEEPDVFGNQFEKFGFIPDLYDDLPIGLKRGSIDATLATMTCAPCHTGRLPDGTAWFGQPNLQINPPGLDLALDERWIKKGHPSKLSQASKERGNLYGPGRFRIDSDGYPQAVAADIPVHYDLAQRSHLATVGGALNARTDIYLSIGSQVGFPLASTPGKIPFPAESKMAALVQFMTGHHPPTPPAQDPTLIAAGKIAFGKARCDACHHPDDIGKDTVTKLDGGATGKDRFPGEDPNYPSGSVHADPYQFYMAFGDPAQSSSTTSSIDPQTLTIIKFGYEHKLDVGFSDGYVAPNLHGLWNSQPYLNNGSVPTLEALLEPQASRPTTFKRGDFTYDTTVPGNGNQGHEFGLDLGADEKAALVVYLKSL